MNAQTGQAQLRGSRQRVSQRWPQVLPVALLTAALLVPQGVSGSAVAAPEAPGVPDADESPGASESSEWDVAPPGDAEVGQLELRLDSIGMERMIDRVLARAVNANQDLIYAGELTVVAFSEHGPQLSVLDMHRDDAGVRMVRDGDEFGRADDTAFGTTSSDELLEVGGVEQVPAQLDRMLSKYEASLRGSAELDTGPALPVQLTEEDTGQIREVLYLDDETGLIVRRETFNRDGQPVRIVAYTWLEEMPQSRSSPVSRPTGASGSTSGRTAHLVAPGDAEQARADGFEVPETLPHGYDLLALFEVEDAAAPTLHLMYGDGLYTVSVFQQQGQFKRDVVDGAARLETDDGGVVWRWPGSEPRRLVFGGGGITFTVLADTPTDELIDVVSELPIDPEPSTLDRLRRGFTRIADWFGGTNDRSAP